MNERTNDPNACGSTFHTCHCMLPAGHSGPHECVPDPVCGGSWLRHPDDERGMVRVYRYPGNRPGCEMYERTRDIGAEDPPDGEHVLEPDGIPRVPRGSISYPKVPSLDVTP